MTNASKKVESFQLDHLSMPAPQVRKAGTQTGPKGDLVSKFDLRFIRPNSDAIPTGAMHTLEHLLATYLRERLDGVIDLSPMGCRTGFYLIVWGDADCETVKDALLYSLKRVIAAEWNEVPGTSAKECGNYRDHSLFGAQEYAKQIIEGLERK